MMITMKSQMTDVWRTLDIDMTQDQYDDWLMGDDLIQHALPHLSDSDREFLMTGITDEEWDSLMVDDDDEGDDYDEMSSHDKYVNDRLDMGRNEAGEWLGWTT